MLRSDARLAALPLSVRFTENAARLLRFGALAMLCTLPLALIELALYPVILRDSLTHWLTYWLYLFLAVILPGSLLVLLTTRWSADWLTWLGLGWVVGHGLELVSFLVAKSVGMTRGFIVWAILVYIAALFAPQDWTDRVKPLLHKRLVFLLLFLVMAGGTLSYYFLNIAELSPVPPYISDVWFHINNVHEFRDHQVIEDPRVYGEPFNYHMYSYAPAAAASEATGAPIALLVSHFGGMSAVMLLIILMFNIGRTLNKGNPYIGALCAFLIICPIDFFALISTNLGFGTSVMLFGIYISTTTLGGYLFFAGLLLPVYWFFNGSRRSDLWVIGLMAFGGAGSKSMIGPLLVCAALAVAAREVVFTRRLNRRSLLLLGCFVIAVLIPSVNLILGDRSYSSSLRLSFVDFGVTTPYYLSLSNRWHPNDMLLRALWIIGFAFPILAGGILAVWAYWKQKQYTDYVVFVWGTFIAALVPGLFLALSGASQLFFLYYGMLALTTIACAGIVYFFRWLARHRRLALVLVFLGVVFGIIAQDKFTAPLSLSNDTTNALWAVRVDNWWSDVFGGTNSTIMTEFDRVALGVYVRPLRLTDDIRAGLEWARLNLPSTTVFAVDNDDASPYAGLSEQRAYFETTTFHVLNHDAIARGNSDLVNEYFRPQHEALDAWKSGAPDAVERLRAGGVTHLYVDRVNGYPVADLPDLTPVFESRDFTIYALPAS